MGGDRYGWIPWALAEIDRIARLPSPPSRKVLRRAREWIREGCSWKVGPEWVKVTGEGREIAIGSETYGVVVTERARVIGYSVVASSAIKPPRVEAQEPCSSLLVHDGDIDVTSAHAVLARVPHSLLFDPLLDRAF